MIHDVIDEEFRKVIREDAGFETVARGFTVTEGIVWDIRSQSLIFSDIPASVVYRWSPASGLEVLRRPSNMTNGNCFDRRGRLLSCEHATSSVSRLEEGGRHFTTLASHYQGQEFNSPNDIVCDSQDRIWFTDPTYGRTSPRTGLARPESMAVRGVYRLDPDGSLTRVAEDFETPNGLCFLPGEEALLVVDTNRMHIRRFAVAADGSLSGGAVFATISGEGEGKPDGIKCDAAGRIYCTGPGGIHVLSPEGRLIGISRAPENTRNFCFGGPDFDRLFFATSTAILSLQLRAKGLPYPTV